MNTIEHNRTLAAATLAALHEAGVRTLCVCPGGRNAPLVLAADAARNSFQVVSFFEERCAGFFALGRIRRDRAPAAVLTTSGTAAAELLPGMLEAQHGGWPLFAVTADRPRRLRGSGAPQTIDQPPLFAATRAPVLDVDDPSQLGELPLVAGPVHVNVCFDEPLVAGSVTLPQFGPAPARKPVPPWMEELQARRACDDFFGRVRNPLVLVSSLEPEDAAAVAPWLASLSSPLYLDAVSQLRGHKTLQEFSLHAGERILLTKECREAIDGVLRIGGVPTPRFWRELDAMEKPVLHVSRQPFPGTAQPAPVVPMEHFLRMAGEWGPAGGKNTRLFQRDRAAAAELEQLLTRHPRSEAALIRAMAERGPDDARIFLGNSLPVREWDLAAPRRPERRTVFANRGVNGIDGLVSTALGLAGSDRPMMAVLGDLSALYDLAGLWPAAQLPGADVTLAVVNNGGGMIFDRMFGSEAFLHRHPLHLRGWAEMFGWHYGTMHTPHDPWPTASPRLIEILPDADATYQWAEAWAAVWR